MSDEIKEKDIDYILEKELSPDRYCYIHNYITNLQQELERYKHYSKTTGIEELMQENERLKIKLLQEQNIADYKSRVEKAIEYIIKHSNNLVEYLYVYEVKDLLNILQGGKDE